MSDQSSAGKEQEALKRMQEDALARARAAAAAGDPRAMLEALDQSKALDGIVRRLTSRWRSIHPLDLDSIVGDVVDGFYVAVKNGQRINSVAGWLWNAAWFKTSDFHRQRMREVPLDPGSLQDRPEHIPIEDEEENRKHWRDQCVAKALALVPNLGEENVKRVMTYILEAWKAGRWEVPNPEIAEALGMNPASVRKWRSRGFRRLIREARRQGLVNPQFNIAELKDSEETEGTGEAEEGSEDSAENE